MDVDHLVYVEGLVSGAGAATVGGIDGGNVESGGPQVFVGEIGRSAALPLLRRRLRDKTMARAIRRLRKVAP